jgi:hypothetical protein
MLAVLIVSAMFIVPTVFIVSAVRPMIITMSASRLRGSFGAAGQIPHARPKDDNNEGEERCEQNCP